MFSWLRNWGPGKLGLSWAAYWVGLGAVTLWTPIQQALRLSKLGDGHSSMSAGFQNTLFHLSMSEDGRTVYDGSAYLLTIILWLTVPPLLMWVAWLRARPESNSTQDLPNAKTAEQLNAGNNFAAHSNAREPEKSPQRNNADRS